MLDVPSMEGLGRTRCKARCCGGRLFLRITKSSLFRTSVEPSAPASRAWLTTRAIRDASAQRLGNTRPFLLSVQASSANTEHSSRGKDKQCQQCEVQKLIAEDTSKGRKTR